MKLNGQDIYEGMIVRHRHGPRMYGKVTKIGNSPFGTNGCTFYEVTIIDTGRKMLYNNTEITKFYEHTETMQVLYAKV